jgi:hypothetical protein
MDFDDLGVSTGFACWTSRVGVCVEQLQVDDSLARGAAAIHLESVLPSVLLADGWSKSSIK